MVNRFFITQYYRGLKREKAPLYFRIRRRNPAIDMPISTQVSVKIDRWDAANADLESFNKFKQSKYGAKILEQCEKAAIAATDLINKGVFDRKIIQKVVFNAVNDEDLKGIEAIQTELQEAEERKREAERLKAEAERNDICFCCSKLVDDIKNNRITYTKNGETCDYSKGSYKKWNSFYNLLCRFCAGKSYTWNDINDNFYNKWMAFLNRAGYMKMTIGKFNACLKHLIIYYKGRDAGKPIAKSFNIAQNRKAAEIALTADEVQALYEAPLKGLSEMVRDSFLFGVYTAQRYSDFSRFTKDMFSVTPRGTEMFMLTQVKTGSTACGPVNAISNNLSELIKKHNGNAPFIDSQIMNRTLKSICKDLSEKVPSLANMVPTVLTMKEIKAEKAGNKMFYRDSMGRVMRPRYDCVSTHSARRTGVTLMYLSKKYDLGQIMTLSGHQTQKECLNYIKQSLNEKIDEMAAAANVDEMTEAANRIDSTFNK